MSECKYHELGCACSRPDNGPSYSRCRRLPYHSEVEMDIAKQHRPRHRPTHKSRDL